MSQEPLHETIGTYLAIVSVIVPAMLVSGFMPDWNVLPFAVWMLIASVGAAIGGAMSTRRLLLGGLAGALVGAGALLGIYYYVGIRAALTGSTTFVNVELAIGAAIGAIPGLLLYFLLAKRSAAAHS